MEPSSTTYVALGLLAKRSGSGYDIAAFAERSLRHFWPVNRSQLYTELSRLEELGWASGTAVEQDRYPNKRVYQTTSAGLAALRHWLDGTSHKRRQRTQDAVVLKTFLGSFMNPEHLADQLRDHREHAVMLHAELSAVIEHLDTKGPTGPHRFGRAAARYGVLQAEATIMWTDEVQELLKANPGPTATD